MELKQKSKARRQALKQPGLEIIYYTDPLCCWSWAFEPQWRRLLFELKDKISYRYCMGGLLPRWKNYNDSVNSVTRPIQMGPVWMHAKQLSGMPIEYNIWMLDPPSSSYPACIAVKCAAMQSRQAEENYLRLLREAVMMKNKNISRQEVIFSVAETLADIDLEFNADQFKENFKNEDGIEAFRKDLQEVQYHGINRFPAMVLRSPDKKGILISGYRPFSVVMDAVKQFIQIDEAQKIDPEEYKSYWPSITERELAEIHALS